MEDPVELLKIRNQLMAAPSKLTLYHGSKQDFDRFAFTGVRLPAMGYGHYLTPNIDKAKQYGPIIIVFDVTANLIDWGRLDQLEQRAIRQLLCDTVPFERLAGYAKLQQKYFSEDQAAEAKTFFEEKRSLTKGYWHDRAKARVDIADGESGFVISWREGGDLSGANCEQLMNLAQEYRHDIARELGYQGARFGDEVVIYSPEYAVKVMSFTHESEIDRHVSDRSVLSNSCTLPMKAR